MVNQAPENSSATGVINIGKISMISEILIRLTYHCSVCNEVKLIEYKVLHPSGRIYGVCRGCRDKLLAEEGIVSEDRTVAIPRAS